MTMPSQSSIHVYVSFPIRDLDSIELTIMMTTKANISIDKNKLSSRETENRIVLLHSNNENCHLCPQYFNTDNV